MKFALPEGFLHFVERHQRILRLLGYPSLALFGFFFSLYVSIPRDRIRERLERELSQDPSATTPLGLGMDVSITDLGLSLVPPGVDLQGVSLKQRKFPPGKDPKDPKQRDKVTFLEELILRTSLVDLIFGTRSGRIELVAFGGEASGSGRLSGSGLGVDFSLSEISLARVPMLATASPLPMGGKLSAQVNFKSTVDPKTQQPILSAANGLLEFSLEDAFLGDGKAKLTVPGDPFLSQGLTFPRVKLGKVSGRIIIEKGRATFDQAKVKSSDAEAILEGYVDLRTPLQLSDLHLYLRFKPSAELVKKEPTFELLMNGMAAGKRPDGFLGFSILGSLDAPRSRPAKDPPGGVGSRSAPLGMGTGTPSPSLSAHKPIDLPPPTPEPPPAPAFVPPPSTYVPPQGVVPPPPPEVLPPPPPPAPSAPAQ